MAVHSYVLDFVSKADLDQALETQTLRLTVRMGLMLAAIVPLLAAVVKLL